MISVGIDVSKDKSMVCFMKPGGEILIKPFEILHTTTDVDNLINLINNFNEEVKVVLESTRHYHLPVMIRLRDNNIFVCIVNALRMKKYCSQNIRRAKTDRIDSIHIASFGLTYWNELIPARETDSVYNELQLLSRQYYQLTSMIVKAKINLNNLIDKVMPGLQKALNDNKSSNRLSEFVKKYKHSDVIKRMSAKRFKADFFRWAEKKGYRVHERLADEIYAIVQNGIPVLPNSQSTKLVVLEAIRTLHNIECSRELILTQMQTLANTLPEYPVVRDIYCIGDVLAPRLIAEIGDIRHFRNKHSLIAYSGIDAPPYQSGHFNGTERHISKRGNRYLRKTGYKIMQSYMMHKPKDNPVYEFIEKKRREGKCGKEAMIAGLNKFLRMYYGKVSELYKA